MGFSEKQQEYFKNANKRWNFKTGATRSGKTYCDYFVIPKRIRERIGKAGMVFILGVSKSTIERNLLEPMRQIWGDKLVGTINSQNKCYLFGEWCYCLGAEKVSQVSKLRGASVKYCYGDEVADWSEDVFSMLKSRLDKPYSCFDGALNPQSPMHWLKAFLDDESLDCYVQKYTIFDNPFLEPDFVENLCKEYEGSVYYKRYILGEWALAEGLVYPMFNRDKHIVTGTVERRQGCLYFASVDYGTVNPFAIGIFEFDGKYSTLIREVYYDGRHDERGRVDNEAYYSMLVEACEGLPIQKVIVDPSAAGFIQTVLKYRQYVVEGANNDVNNGIQEVTKYLNYGLLKIHESCEHTIREFQSYCWNDKYIDNGKDSVVIKQADHMMDALRYYIFGVARVYNAWVV